MIKKIYLIRSNKTKFGGAENYLSRLSKALEKNNIDHKIINSSMPKFLPSWLRALLFNLQLCLIKKDKFFYSLDRITCPDVYRAGDGVHKVFLSIEDKSKINLLHPVYLYLEKKCLRNAKRIIANSKMVKNEIINTYQINPKKIDIVHNGIKLKEMDYSKSFEKLSLEFSISKNQFIFLFVGSGFKRKGVEEFLKIISIFKSKNIKAFVVGKESKLKFYFSLAKKLNIDDKVIFTGPRTDVDDFYTISDIFLFPTHYDPFSNVVLEALNFENIVFTTCKNGASEILENQFIMSNPFDLKIIPIIEKLLTNKIYLKQEKMKNKKISKGFPIEENLYETMKIIEEVDRQS